MQLFLLDQLREMIINSLFDLALRIVHRFAAADDFQTRRKQRAGGRYKARANRQPHFGNIGLRVTGGGRFGDREEHVARLIGLLRTQQ